jgi:Flp pilus assembly protein CpaB
MDATTTGGKIGRTSPRDVLSTRSGAIAVAVIAAILAGVLLFAFVQHYKAKENASAASTPVFVARTLIPQGMSADVIGSEQLLERTSVRGSAAQAGAISDPSVLHGEVAAKNIYPGQQLTASDFTTGSGIASELTASTRAISVPIDSAHGLAGVVHTGDHVDVLASYTGGSPSARGSVTTLLQNVLVLSAPTSGSGVGSSNNSDIVLRVSSKDAASVAYAADNGKVWIVLRPPLANQQAEASSSASAAPSATSSTTTTTGH